MKAASTHAKGRRLEKDLVDALRQSGIDPKAYRVAGSGSGLDKGDVVAPNANWVFECKNQKASSPLAWIKQLEDEMRTKAGANGAVVWSPPYVPFDDSLVILRLWAFKALLRPPASEGISTDDRDTAYQLKTLIQAAKRLLKRFDQ